MLHLQEQRDPSSEHVWSSISQDSQDSLLIFVIKGRQELMSFVRLLAFTLVVLLRLSPQWGETVGYILSRVLLFLIMSSALLCRRCFDYNI